jgi:hypothetical protein
MMKWVISETSVVTLNDTTSRDSDPAFYLTLLRQRGEILTADVQRQIKWTSKIMNL